MRPLGLAALLATILAVWLMLTGAAIGECTLIVLAALVLAVLELAQRITAMVHIRVVRR